MRIGNLQKKLMWAYASRTGTLSTLAALRAAQWRLLVSATGRHNNHGFPFALDNGAWTAHQSGRSFDVPAFLTAFFKFSATADWCAAPDIVGGGHASLDLSLRWLPMMLNYTQKVLIPVQDGMQPQDLVGLCGARVGVFLGGSTDWKLATMKSWGTFSSATGCWFHVGRVNSAKRIALCASSGADSFDGTSVTRFSCTLPRLDAARLRHCVIK